MAEEVENLVVRLSFDSMGFQNGVTGINRSLKLIQSEFKASAAKLKDFGKGTDGLKLQSESLTKQITLQKQKVDALRKSTQESIDKKGEDSKATQNLAIKTNKAVEELNKMERQLSETNTKIKTQSSGWQDLSKKINSAGKQMQTIGNGMSQLGSSLTFSVTAPIVGVGVAAGKAAIDFESAFTDVKKTVNGSAEDFSKLEKQIRSMSKTIPSSASDIAEVAATAGQLGIHTKDIASFTKTMIDLGNSTNLSADDAASALARLANITQMPQNQFRQLGSTIVALGNNLATTESEITDMGLRIAGAGHQVGLTEPQILSFAGALSSVGIDAEAGGTAISRVMLTMQTAVKGGGKSLDAFAKVAGVSSKDFRQSFEKNAAGAITTFIEGLGKMSKSGKDLTPTLKDLGLNEIRVRDALLRASGAGDLFRKSLDLGNKAWDANNALTKEANKRYDTTASQLKIFKNRITDVGIDLGRALIPALLDTVDALEPLFDGLKKGAKWFADLNPHMQKLILGFAGIVAAIGPLSMMFGPLIAGLGALSVAFTAAEISMMGILGPVGLIVGGLTAVGLAMFAFGGKQKELQKVNLDTANSMIAQHDANAKMIDQYDDLRNKCQLTNDEFGRYLDIQDELKKATDPEVVKSLKDEMENLRKKSGLSNDQLNKMVDLNDKLTDKLPVATDKITEQGNRIAGTTDKLKKYNDELAKATLLELDEQYQTALSNQKDLLSQKKDLQDKHNAGVKEEQKILDIIKNYNKEEIQDEIKKHEEKLKQLNVQQAYNAMHGINNDQLNYQVKLEADMIKALEGGKQKLVDQMNTQHKQNEEIKKKLDQTNEEISKYDVVKQKLETQLMVQAGINEAIAEQAAKRGDEIGLIDLTIAKLLSQKKTLEDQTPPNQRNTDEYKKQISAIDDQIDKLKAARGQIIDMKDDAVDFTKALGASVNKDVGIKFNVNWGSIPVKNRSAVMGQIRAWQLQGFATGTDNYPGGWGLVGEEGPELVKLPAGSQIFPNNVTNALMERLGQIPQLAVGGTVTKSGLALVGERGRELYKAPAASTVPLTNGANALSNETEVPEYVVNHIYLDKDKFVTMITKPVKDKIDAMNYIEAYNRGDI